MVDGVDVTTLSGQGLFSLQKRFGYLFQGAALFDSMTVGENVAFGLRNLRPDLAKDWKNIAIQKLALVGLGYRVADLKPAELSGGMKKRVALARAVAYEPDYILYDEPTTGLDPIMSDVINDLILELRQKLGVTAVAVTHDMKSAYKISNRIAMLFRGKIVSVGTPEEIQNSSDPLVHQFITGSSHGPIQMQIRGIS
jgi:phospholipid/cholesterol/gamma-HCH transport system ATP-binding protein